MDAVQKFEYNINRKKTCNKSGSHENIYSGYLKYSFVMQFKRRKVQLNNIFYVIFLQNLFCINRTNCLEKKNYKILSKIIFCISLTTVIVFNILEIVTHIIHHTKLKDLQAPTLFAYFYEFILVTELLGLIILAKRNDSFHKKIKVLDEKCETIQIIRNEQTTEEETTNNKSKKIITLSLLSVFVDILGLNYLDYPASVILTLTVAFAAHDTELFFYSVIVHEYNAKMTTLMDVGAEVGTKMYRHVLIASKNFTEDFKYSISLAAVMTFAQVVIYIGTAIVIEGPRKQRVLSYFVWRELRSLFSLWLLCSACYQTRILCDGLVKNLSEKLVFDLDSKDKSSRKLTKRWLKCVKLSPVQYLDDSCYTLNPALPLALIDYSTNYFLIIVQMYPILLRKNRRSQAIESI